MYLKGQQRKKKDKIKRFIYDNIIKNSAAKAIIIFTNEEIYIFSPITSQN